MNIKIGLSAVSVLVGILSTAGCHRPLGGPSTTATSPSPKSMPIGTGPIRTEDHPLYELSLRSHQRPRVAPSKLYADSDINTTFFSVYAADSLVGPDPVNDEELYGGPPTLEDWFHEDDFVPRPKVLAMCAGTADYSSGSYTIDCPYCHGAATYIPYWAEFYKGCPDVGFAYFTLGRLLDDQRHYATRNFMSDQPGVPWCAVATLNADGKTYTIKERMRWNVMTQFMLTNAFATEYGLCSEVFIEIIMPGDD